MRKLFTITLCLFIFTFCQAQKVDLSLNLEKGKTYTQAVNSTANINQDINGQNVQMVMGIQGGMSYLVKEIKDSAYEMEVRFDRLNMKMQLPQGSMEFSSEKKDEQDVFSMILAEMVGKPFEVSMSRNGKVKEVRNIESVFEGMFKKFPQLSEEQKAQLKNQLMQAYGEKAFKGNIEMVTAVFPDKPVSPGDQWKIETQLESGMSANMVTTYKFEENGDSYYKIHGDAKIETADKDAYIESNGMPLKYDLKGTMVSDIRIDKESGWVLDAKLKQEIGGDAYIKKNPQLPQGMKIPMTMDSEILISNYELPVGVH